MDYKIGFIIAVSLLLITSLGTFLTWFFGESLYTKTKTEKCQITKFKTGWKYCSKCALLYNSQAGSNSLNCAAGGNHQDSGQAFKVGLEANKTDSTQQFFMFCLKCACLIAYNDFRGSSVCYDKQPHQAYTDNMTNDTSKGGLVQSYNYYVACSLPVDIDIIRDKNTFQICHQCAGICPSIGNPGKCPGGTSVTGTGSYHQPETLLLNIPNE